MLTPADDYPLHQTPEPIAIVGENRNFYDRFFFNGYNAEGSIFFAAALGVYPHLNVMDASFCLSINGKQYNLRASKEMYNDRLDLKVGPVCVEIMKPLERTCLIIKENEYGISGTLYAKSRHKAFAEPRFTHKQNSEIFIDCTRATQNITWTGDIKFQNKLIKIDGFMGTRDRSWGLRPIGKKKNQENTSNGSPQFYWLWTPMNFPQHCVFYHKNDDSDGKTWNSCAVIHDLENNIRLEEERPKSKVQYKNTSRRVSNLNIELKDANLEFTMGKKFYMQGLGYSHPIWGHGNHHGPMKVGFDIIDLEKAEQDLAKGLLHNLHIQTLANITLKISKNIYYGQGVVEQLFIGPHKPSQFKGLLDRITE